MGDIVGLLREATAPGLQLRTGRVVYLDASRITVQVAGGDSTDMPAPRGGLIVLGDYVQVLSQGGGVWWCLGAPDGLPPDGVLANPSFEIDPAGTSNPTSWTVYHDPGFASSTVSVAIPATFPADGTNVLSVADAGTAGSNTYVSSEAVAVQPGQVWTAAASVLPSITGTLAGSNVRLLLTWHTHQTDVWPTVAGTQIIDAWTVPLGAPLDWGLLRQHAKASGIIVPDGLGVTWMRVALHTRINGPGTVNWDRIILRRLST